MATFEVLVRQIDDVVDHPNADRLSICKILGYEAITNKREDDAGNLVHRYAKGDLIVYVPEAAVVPEHLLKQYGYWDDEKGKGMLAGKAGNRVKAIRLRQVVSQGLVWPLRAGSFMGEPMLFADNSEGGTDGGMMARAVREGDDVAEYFGITKYEPPVPMGMSGEVAAVYEFALDFDIENEQNYPGFLDHDEVEAREKIHGTCFRVAFRPEIQHEELFGSGKVAIASKGLGAKGLVFKNNEVNAAGNLYVRTALELGLPEKIEALGSELNESVDLLGEIFGPGVQDLHYGMKVPEFQAFDIAVGGRFLSADEKSAMFERLGVKQVPLLYRGPWDRDALIAVRDGKTTLGGQNVREGVVVTAVGPQDKREVGAHRLRPILKMINPDYLLRKNATEYN